MKKENKSPKDILNEHDRKLKELLESSVEEELDEEDLGEESDEEVDEPASNNGHKPSENLEETEPIAREDETIDIDLDEREIPAKGFIYAPKDDYLPEVTRLSAKMIFALTFGHAKNEILNNPNRTQSFFEIYSNRLMRHQIGLEGKGRDEWFAYKNTIAQEKAESEYTQRGL